MKNHIEKDCRGVSPELGEQQRLMGELELYDNLLPQLEDISRGIKTDLMGKRLSDPANTSLIIPVIVAGASLGGKTTVLSQLWEEHSRDSIIQSWQNTHGINQAYYFLDTGMVRELGTHLGIIKNQQGGLTLPDYQGLSDLTEEVVPLGIQYLKGPGQLGLEFVLTTAIWGKNDQLVGIPRGSLRLVQSLVASNNARLIVLVTTEELKDHMGEVREQARSAKPEDVAKIAYRAGNVHSLQNPDQIHAIYMLASNNATRIQQAHDTASVIWTTCPDQHERFSENFTDFREYYFGDETAGPKLVLNERRIEWEPLVLRSHEKWLGQMFHLPYDQVSRSRGAVIENTLLVHGNEEGDENETSNLNIVVPRHVYDARLLQVGLFKALIDRSKEIDSSTLRTAVKRLELNTLNVYYLT